MQRVVLLGVLLLSICCGRAFGAAQAVVASCAPGKETPAQTLVGLLKVHVICDRVIFEIPLAGLNRDLLVNTEFAALSTGTDFVAPGSVVDRFSSWVDGFGFMTMQRTGPRTWSVLVHDVDGKVRNRCRIVGRRSSCDLAQVH